MKIKLALFTVLLCIGIAGEALSDRVVQQDDFESEVLSPLWVPAKVSANALQYVSSPVRTGSSALKICVQPYDKPEIGGDYQLTERAELREAPGIRLKMGVESWYSFSFFIPSDFPIVETRLVIARWKQSFNEPEKDRSPMIALRYMGGKLKVDVSRDRGKRQLFIQKIDMRNQWVDMVFHIIPKASKQLPSAFKEGVLQAWMNGKQIVDYQGALGFVDDESEMYFKLGPYRDHVKTPMCIVYDRFRRGSSFEEVAISNQ